MTAFICSASVPTIVSRQSFLFVLAAVPRGAALLNFGQPEPNYYRVLSENILKHHTFALESGPTTYMEPVYPSFLALARLISGDVAWLVMLIQVAVASAGAVFLWQLTHLVTGSARAALIAAVLYAIDPYFVRQSASYLELPLLLTLLAWMLKRFFRLWTAVPAARSEAGGGESSRDAAVTGTLIGTLFLTRASLFPACLAAVTLLAARRGRRLAVLCGGCATLVVLPWVVRCYAIDGSILPSRVGENLFVSTSEYAIGVLPEHDVDLLVPFAHELVDRELPHLSPAELDGPADDLLLSRALEFAVSHPRETLELKLRNLLYLFWPGILPVEAKSPDTRAVLEGSRVRILGARQRPRIWEWMHAGVRTVVLVAAAIGLARPPPLARRRAFARRWRIGCCGPRCVLPHDPLACADDPGPDGVCGIRIGLAEL